MKRITIITVNYNNCAGLQRTIQSVLTQSTSDFEYIIIDGGSTDGSKRVLEKHSDKLAYWTSERDGGIYQAMNKGIRAAKGDYILFLNSGDRFISTDVLENVGRSLDGTPIVYGDGVFELAGGEKVAFNVPAHLTLDYFSKRSLCHAASFIKRDLFEQHGLYNESNRIVSDWEFFLKTIMVNGVTARKIDLQIALMDGGGISRDKANAPLLWAEVEDALNRHFPPSVIALIRDFEKLRSELTSGQKATRRTPLYYYLKRLASRIVN